MFNPQTQREVQLVERLALLFWREIRLTQAEAFQSKANKLNADHQDQDYFPDRQPKYFQAQEGIVPIEKQLLIGRYQTMLSNQIAQTLSQLRHEQKLRAETIDLELTKIWFPA